MMRKRLVLVQLIVVLGMCVLSAFAAPAQNASFDAPQISTAISCDGSLADWGGKSSYTSLPFIFWNGTVLTSNTTMKFAWNDAMDMLYVAIQTDEHSAQVGGYAVIGFSLDNTSTPNTDGRSTQIGFERGTGNTVIITNEINAYGLRSEGIAGIQAGQSLTGGITTYEIAIPFWTDWSTGSMNVKQTLYADRIVYLYAVMQDQFMTSNGTNLTYAGNPGFGEGARWNQGTQITLVTDSPTPQCGDAGHPIPLYDFNRDCHVDFEDFATFAVHWMECTRPVCD